MRRPELRTGFQARSFQIAARRRGVFSLGPRSISTRLKNLLAKTRINHDVPRVDDVISSRDKYFEISLTSCHANH